MKRVLISMAVVLAIVIPAAGTFATSGHDYSKTAKSGSSKAVSAVCPVMGAKIPDIKKLAGKSVYKGKTYYFCCKGCKPKFDKDTDKYVNKKK